MSAIADSGHARHPRALALRTLVAAGGWSNGLILLGMVAGLLLPLLGLEPGKGFGLGVVLAATFTMFWAFLAGGRLFGLLVLSLRLQLPHTGRATLDWLAWALVLAVLLPAMAHDNGDYALAAAGLAFGASVGLLWVSLPPWAMWILIALSMSMRWLPAPTDAEAWVARFTSPAWIASAALALLAASALCAWREVKRIDTRSSPWSTPLALTFNTGIWLQPGQAQNYGSSLFGADTPVGSELRREPEQALGIALGPGFGRITMKSMFSLQGPIVAVVVFWMFLGVGADDGNVASDIGLKFAPLLALSTALAPFVRLQTLYLRPALGLHEPALLPGLPARAPARALVVLLLWRALAGMLPALALMAAFGLYMGAGSSYIHLLLWTTFGSAALIGGMALLSLHSRAMRWATVVVVAAVCLAMLATMALPAASAQALNWLLPAWGLALLCGTGLWLLALARLQARPHPWLQN